jgi:hypothetical protein
MMQQHAQRCTEVQLPTPIERLDHHEVRPYFEYRAANEGERGGGVGERGSGQVGEQNREPDDES